MDRSDGKVAVVTGAARGIGRAISLRLARDGADIVLADINLSGVESVADEVRSLGRSAIARQVDVTDEQQVEALFGDATRELGRVDIAVANAGIIVIAPMIDTAIDDWQRLFDVNVTGVWFTCKFAAKQMIAQGGGGKIILAASQAGKMASTRMVGAYSATKHAVIGITRSLGVELAKHKINVNAYCPGIVDTAMWDQIDREAGALDGFKLGELKALTASRIPLGRIEVPEDVANLVSFLASSDSDYMTGQAINITGGSIMH